MTFSRKKLLITIAIVFFLMLLFLVVLDTVEFNYIVNLMGDKKIMRSYMFIPILRIIIFSLVYLVSISFVGYYFGRQSKYDNLTGLANKNKLQKDLKKLISKKRKFHVGFIDLNGFKQINDTHGHILADKFLIEFANKLKKLKPNTKSYRYAGDEFVVIVLDDYDNIQYVHDLVGNEVVIDDVSIKVDFSIGVQHGHLNWEVEELLKMADQKMYKEKKDKRK